jgi:signal transduction histidine kinase
MDYQAGLAFDWQVDALPPWTAGTDEAMRHLQFLLLEAISNTLQHARARTLVLSARSDGRSISIALCDDGEGMGTNSGRGLQFMRDRARAIGATLIIDSDRSGTQVNVGLQL